jgi:hypothetical protein
MYILKIFLYNSGAMKSLMFWKYVVAVILVSWGTVHVSGKYQYAAKQCEEKRAKVDQRLIPPAGHAEKTDECTENAERDFPGWFGFFRWPNGTTALAILVTLLAIAEQANQTRRSADIANRTLNAILRPKLIIRRIRIHRGTDIPTCGQPDADAWRIDFEMVNVGKGTSRIVGHNFRADRMADKFPDFGLEEKTVPPFELKSGEKQTMSIPIVKELVFILRLIGVYGLTQTYQGTERLFFWGNAQYLDTSNVRREVSVCRLYDNKAGRFRPIADPDYEYSD